MEGNCTFFSMALGTKLVLLGQRKSGQDISVVCTQWDYDTDRFLPPRKWIIHVSDKKELLAADIVGNYETGELQPYVVVANRSALAIGVLDIFEDSFTIVTEVPISSDFWNEDPSAKIKCLLTNGPTIVASMCGKILVVYPNYVGDIKHGDQCHSSEFWGEYKDVEHSWVTYIVNFNEIINGADVKVLFAHDGTAASTPEVVLGTNSACMDIMSPQQETNNLQGLQVGWQYIRMDLYSLGCCLLHKAKNNSCHYMNQTWVKVYEKSTSFLCNDLFPTDLNPFAISCIKLVPADPSSLAFTALGLDKQHSKSFPDVIIATYDCKILKCRNGKIVADAFLKDVPLSLAFAVVAGGQGVLLATLSGADQNVIAFCCETLQQLQVWSNVANVVIGDFQLAGHDQVLLVKSPSYKPGPFPLEEFLNSIFITDFKSFGLVGLSDRQQELKFSERFQAIDHKSRHMQNVARFLEARIEAGRLQEHHLQLLMEEKKHLVKSSCKLMEEMIVRPMRSFFEKHSPLARKKYESIKGNGLRLMEIEQLYHGLHGRRWVLLIGVRSKARRGLILDGATLLLTTVQGQIAGSTSTARRIDVEDKLYKFVVEVPLRNFTAFSCFPSVNVMFKAWLTYEEGVHHQSIGSPVHEHNPPHKKFSYVFDETHRCLHTEWLGRICIGQSDLIRQFVPRGLSHAIREVGESQLFIFRPKAVTDPFQLPHEMKSVLCMDFCGKEYDDLQMIKRRTCELVTRSSSPFGHAYVYILKDITLLTLCAEDSEFLSCMGSLLISHFGHQYDVCQSGTFEHMLESILAFTGTFLQELGPGSFTLKSSHAVRGDGQSMDDHLKVLELLTDQACLHLIPF